MNKHAIVQPSKAYKELKKLGKAGKPFKAKLTIPLAKELLSRADDCGPINPDLASEIAWAMCNKTFNINTDFILVFKDTDNLGNGVQRLAGFLESGLKKMDIYFQFVEQEGANEWVEKLRGYLTPTAQHNILRLGAGKKKLDTKELEKMFMKVKAGETRPNITFEKFYQITRGKKPSKKRVDRFLKHQADTKEGYRAIARLLIGTINKAIPESSKFIWGRENLYDWIAAHSTGQALTASDIASLDSLTLSELLETLFID